MAFNCSCLTWKKCTHNDVQSSQWKLGWGCCFPLLQLRNTCITKKCFGNFLHQIFRYSDRFCSKTCSWLFFYITHILCAVGTMPMCRIQFFSPWKIINGLKKKYLNVPGNSLQQYPEYIQQHPFTMRCHLLRRLLSNLQSSILIM